MKKTFVRILAFLLVLCMFFSMIACGAKDQPEDTPAAPSEEVSANPPAQPESGSEEREHVELIFYTHANAIFAGFDKTMAAVNEYLKEKLNTTVDFRIYEQSTYKDTVNPAFMSGDEMDCLLVGSTGIDFATNVSKNAFIDISSYIDTYLPGTKARLPEAAWDAYSYQGGIYGICSIKDLANQLGIYTNDTLLNDLGIEFPADTYYTWKDLVPFFYEVQAARDAKYPEKAGKPMLAANEAGQCIFYDFYDFLVGSYSTPLVITGIPGLQDYEGVKSGEEVTSYFYTDEFREYCEIIKGFRDNGLIQFEFNPEEYTSLYDGDAIGGIVWGDLSVDAAQRGYSAVFRLIFLWISAASRSLTLSASSQSIAVKLAPSCTSRTCAPRLRQNALRFSIAIFSFCGILQYMSLVFHDGIVSNSAARFSASSAISKYSHALLVTINALPTT